MLTKYAECETLEVISVPKSAGHARLARLRAQGHRHHFEYTPRPGFIYVRSRAISSRCNDNFDMFPAEEIKKAYRTFIGKPVFVNHKNADHRRARGVIIDAALHEDTNPDGSPDTWAEVLMEVDAVRFPVLAREVEAGNIARTSMGTDVQYSTCTACGNKAYTPADYCPHIPKMKGMKIRRKNAVTGGSEEVLIAEVCYGLGFFENSLLVEPPADPTAFVLGVESGDMAKAASLQTEADLAEKVTVPITFRGETHDVEMYLHTSPSGKEYSTIPEGYFVGTIGRGSARYPCYATADKMPDGSWRLRGTTVIRNRQAMIVGWAETAGHTNERNQIRNNGSMQAESARCPQCNPGMDPTVGALCHSHAFVSEYYDGLYAKGPAVPGAYSVRLIADEVQSPWVPKQGSAVAALLAEAADDLMRCTNCDGALKGDYDNVECTKCGWNYDPKSLFADYAHSDGPYAHKVLRIDQHGLAHAVDYHDPHTSAISLSPAQRRALESVGEWGGINATPATFRWLKDRDLVEVDMRSGRVTLTDKGREALGQTGTTGHLAALKPVIIKASEIRPGDRLDISGKTRVDSRHPRTDKVLVKTQTRGARSPSIQQWEPDEEIRVFREAMRQAMTQRFAYGETKAPAKVDTMRAEACPVCGDNEAYNGEQCNVCGYTQPPEQFRDPDLSKAKEMDLRQEQADDLGVNGPVDAEAPQEDLQCTNCGEVFSAEGDAATDTNADDQTAAPEADPEHPDSAKDGDGQKADGPRNLDDLADLSDDEIFGDDDEEEEEADPHQGRDPKTAPDPAATGEGRVTPDGKQPVKDPAPDAGDEVDTDPTDPDDEDLDAVDDAPIAPNMTCPVCGEGTLVPVDPASAGQDDLDPTADPTAAPAKPNKVPSKNSLRHSVGAVQKEASTDMPNTPNEAQRRRSLMVRAIKEQQEVIDGLQARNAALTRAVATLACAAGAGKHPLFAGLVREAGLTHLADSAQNPEGAPATTTEEAKKPQATDDVNSVGAAPAEVNKDVTPAAVTDVSNSNVAVNPPVLDNLQDVTAPVAGTDAPTPAAGDAAGTSTVTVGTPDQKTFDSTGPSWKSSARGDDRERFVASVRLARLQIEAGAAQGEDMVVAQQIDASEASLAEINASITAIEMVRQASATQAQHRERTRGLVPRAAQRQGIQPAGAPSLQTQAQAVVSRPGEDEWMVDSGDLG